MNYWRGHGFYVGKAEHWNAFAKIRQDLFGFIDLLAVPKTQPLIVASGLHECGRIVGIQVTTKTNASEHIHKIKTRPEAMAWLQTSNRIVLDAWHKVKDIWQLEQTEIEL